MLIPQKTVEEIEKIIADRETKPSKFEHTHRHLTATSPPNKPC